MNIHNYRQLFKRSSTSFYNSTLFFPKSKQEQVIILYAFVRTVDEFVDTLPADAQGFQNFKQEFFGHFTSKKTSTNKLICDFSDLARKCAFETSWIEAFFDSMEMDLHKKNYLQIEATYKYIYGSAEVIGLFMNRIMGVETAGDHYAQMLGRAYQLINMVRDINEDLMLRERIYLPQSELERFGLSDLKYEYSRKHQKDFRAFINFQLERFEMLLKEAHAGLGYLPYRFRVPILTASDAFLWTAAQIRRDPFQIYTVKVKPSRLRVVLWGLRNLIIALL